MPSGRRKSASPSKQGDSSAALAVDAQTLDASLIIEMKEIRKVQELAIRQAHLNLHGHGMLVGDNGNRRRHWRTGGKYGEFHRANGRRPGQFAAIRQNHDRIFSKKR